MFVEFVEYPTRSGLLKGLLGFRKDPTVVSLEVLDAGRLLRVTRDAEPVDEVEDVPVAPEPDPEPAPEPDPEPEPELDPEPSSATIRAWAKDQGIDVPTRGRVPADIVTAYTSAQS